MRLVSTVGEMFSFLLLFIHFVLSVRVRILRIMTGDGKQFMGWVGGGNR